MSEDTEKNKETHSCCLCRSDTSKDMQEDKYVVTPNGEYTQFGLILIYILKMTSMRLLTNVCCECCRKTVLATFEQLVDLNLSAVVTGRLSYVNSLPSAIAEGCHMCGAIFPEMTELTDHFIQHILEESAKNAFNTEIWSLNAKERINFKHDKVEDLIKNAKKLRPKLRKTTNEKLPTVKQTEPVKEEPGDESDAEEEAADDDEAEPFEDDGNSDRDWSPPPSPVRTKKKSLRKEKKKESESNKKKDGDGKSKVRDEADLKKKCPECKTVFTELEEMVNHMVKEHHSNASNIYNAICKSRLLKCPKCDSKFHRHFQLKNHAKQEHGSMDGIEIRCDLCPKLFTANSRLVTHIHRLHMPSAEVVCEQCGMKCSNHASYKLHKRRHRIRGDTFRPNFKLTKTLAQRKHGPDYVPFPEPESADTNDRPKLLAVPSCTICHKDFPERQLLACHMAAIHNRTTKATLRIKFDRHVCPLCGIQFTRFNELRSHCNKNHPNEKPLAVDCEICSTRCANPAALKQHVLAHHTEHFQYRCCGIPYRNRESWKRHCMKKHGHLRNAAGEAKERGVAPTASRKRAVRVERPNDGICDETERISNSAETEPLNYIRGKNVDDEGILMHHVQPRIEDKFPFFHAPGF